MTRRLMLVAVTLLVVSCASAPQATPDAQESSARTAPRYGVGPGDSPVGAIPDASLTDATRNRTVRFDIEYPNKPGSFPLVIWSHGYGGSSRGYVGLSSYWASHGYVVIKPMHADAGRVAATNVRDVFETQTPADWQGRVRDITLILDSLDKLETDYPELKGKIDRTRIGVGGHSYGAYTAMLLGGVRTFPGGTSYADPRVKAVVAFSPQGPATRLGLTSESYATLRVPALFVTGSHDEGFDESETPEWRKQAFDLSPAGDKWFLLIPGATHLTFAGRSVEAPERVTPSMRRTDAYGRFYPDTPLREQGRIPQHSLFVRARNLALGFWDTYLRGDEAGRKYIEGVTAIEKK